MSQILPASSRIQVEESLGGLTAATLFHESGAQATVFTYGAHVTSFKSKSGEELLFVSKSAVYKEGKAIRGGIPVCWPQFAGVGELPQHGFLRNNQWQLMDARVVGSDVVVVLTFEDSDATRKIWPHSFGVTYTVTLRVVDGREELETVFSVLNRNTDQPFSFTGALHTYFRIADIGQAAVRGFEGVTYIDNMRGKQQFQESGAVKASGETERIYIATPADFSVVDPSVNYAVGVHKEGFGDCVVWNPHVEKSKGMADFGDDEWHQMLCAESAVVTSPVTVAPGATWTGRQVLSRL
eukprot:TRINITY_DN7131_c0_g1_i1.p1 TRINITY_DN7131_c0_g1~~TRINITY_DN7131_c0_g1_i1.p1  ORF type:complete len:317 (-),score=87.54 TRINITY_DN7131_c0_g1_i1:130-1017(-)